MASYPTSAAMSGQARKGLRLREKHKRGGLDTREAGRQGIGSGVARARDIASGRDLPIETWRRVAAFFERTSGYRDAAGSPSRGYYGDDTNPSAGYIAHLLWGGYDAGRKRAAAVIAKHEAARDD